MRQYSRSILSEEKRNFRSAVLFIFLTILALILLFFIGIPALGRFTAFVSDIAKSDKAIDSNDKTPPAPPRFDTFSDFTNQENVNISGSGEAGATVKLTFNGEELENVVDKSGKFTFSLDLDNGENTFSGEALDQAGNLSQKTQVYKIIFDKKEPDLNIDSPGDGTQFFGSNQRQVNIKGSTEANCQVTVNDRIVAVDSDGKFQYTSSLGDGENRFNIKSTDQAGNTTEKNLTLNFSS